MFSPLMTAEFPTYDEAFAYTQAYTIENGISLMKKRTNYRERGGPVRNQVLCCDRGSYHANRAAYQPLKENRKRQRGSAQTACEYTVRGESGHDRRNCSKQSLLMMPSAQAFSSSAPARPTPTLPSPALINTNSVVPEFAFDLELNPSTGSPGSPDVEFVCGKLAPYHQYDELFANGASAAYATISTMTEDGSCSFRAIAKGVYGDESFYKTVRLEMTKQLLFLRHRFILPKPTEHCRCRGWPLNDENPKAVSRDRKIASSGLC